METTTYIRKPLTVQAVQVTEENILEVAKWCKGKVYLEQNGLMTLEVKVIHPMSIDQNKAQEGDWILKSKQGFKIYADSAFKKGFEKLDKDLQDIGDALREKLAPVPATEALQFNAPTDV